MSQYPENSDLYQYSKNMRQGPEFIKGRIYSSLKVSDFSEFDVGLIRPIIITGSYNFTSPISDNYKDRRLNIFVDSSGVIVDSYYF